MRTFSDILVYSMRTNIEIDDTLITEALAESKAATKRQVIDQALKEYVRLLRRRKATELRGTVGWSGSLDQMRSTR